MSAKVDHWGFVTRVTSSNSAGLSTVRNWFLPFYNSRGLLVVNPGPIALPKHLEGKRVRFKMEVLK